MKTLYRCEEEDFDKEISLVPQLMGTDRRDCSQIKGNLISFNFQASTPLRSFILEEKKKANIFLYHVTSVPLPLHCHFIVTTSITYNQHHHTITNSSSPTWHFVFHHSIASPTILSIPGKFTMWKDDFLGVPEQCINTRSRTMCFGGFINRRCVRKRCF